MQKGFPKYIFAEQIPHLYQIKLFLSQDYKYTLFCSKNQ